MRSPMILITRLGQESEITFRSKQALSRVCDVLLTETPTDVPSEVVLCGHDAKIVVDSNDIKALYHHPSFIISPVTNVSIVGESGSQVCFPVSGPRRANSVFAVIQMLLKREPTNRVLIVNQDENKQAFYRHTEKIVQVSMEEIKK